MNRLTNDEENHGSVPEPLVQVFFAGLTPEEQDVALEYVHEVYKDLGGAGLAVTHWNGFSIGRKVKPGDEPKEVTPPKVPRPREN